MKIGATMWPTSPWEQGDNFVIYVTLGGWAGRMTYSRSLASHIALPIGMVLTIRNYLTSA